MRAALAVQFDRRQFIMATKKTKFPTPSKPRSLKSTVKKIIAEPDFAKFIHGHVRKARAGDADSAATIAKHFKPQPAELKALNLKPSEFAVAQCTNNTTHFMLDFAANV